MNETRLDGIGRSLFEVRFLDLFSGIGAMRLGFEQACGELGIKPLCVGYSEIDSKAIETYLRHFPGTLTLGDIRALAASTAIPDCDVMLAGFCCQAFSKAGKKHGFDDARGTLFFSLAAILEAKRPKAFLFENVEHLVHHDNGQTLKRILEIVGQLGYTTTWKVLNSRDFGAPQNRARIFLVGFREGGDGFRFPEPTNSTTRLKDILEADPVDPRYYLSEQNLAGARRRKADNEAKGKGFGYRILDPDGVSNTLVCGGSGREGNLVIDRRIAAFPVLPHRKSQISDECIRHLTPLEWERLQGLPDGFTGGQADCHRYRQLGNAITAPAIRAISRNILEALKADVPTAREQASSSSVNGAVAAQVPPIGPASDASHGVPGAFKFIDLCCGIGGIRRAMDSLGGVCVMSSEIDDTARLVYHANYGVWPAGDICQIKGEDIPDHDILCAGFPCQPFSICGKQKGFADKTRGTIFFEIARIIKAKQPDVVILENVPRLVTHDHGRTFAVIQGTLQELGYVVSHAVLNASLYGSPTARKRVYIVAFRTDLNICNFEFPKPSLEKVTLADVLLPDSEMDRWVSKHPKTIDEDIVARASRTTALKLIRVGHVGTFTKAKQGYRVYSPCGHAVTFCAHGGGMGAKSGLYYINGRVRKLDPRECLRVMGYPDSFVIPPSIKPDQVRTLTGNTVVVPVVRVIGESIVAALSKANWNPIGNIPAAIQSAPTTKADRSIQLQSVVASPQPAPALPSQPAPIPVANGQRLLCNGLSKKGPLTWAFSIAMPNGRCPFASSICSRLCYAEVGQFPFHQKLYERNLEASGLVDFADRLRDEIETMAWKNSGQRIAICAHEKGDFHSVEYLRSWGRVMSETQCFPNVSYFVYTRSWISPAFRVELDRIAAECRNVRINLSLDSEMVDQRGVPARVGDGLLVYLAETDQDLPPAGVDIVLRNLRVRDHAPMERLGGSLVCPNESGLYIAKKDGEPVIKGGKTVRVRCQDCQICLNRSLQDWERVKHRYEGTPQSVPGAVAA